MEATAAEARWLADAGGREAVALHRVAGAGLATHLAGTATLRTLAPVLLHRPDRAARLLADLAGAVDRLHRRGLVHGRLTLDHVVLAGPERDRPKLCSPAGTATRPIDDVAGLIGIAEDLAAIWGWDPPGWRNALDDLEADWHRLRARSVAQRLERLALSRSLRVRASRFGLLAIRTLGRPALRERKPPG
jgi:hypothetical protein